MVNFPEAVRGRHGLKAFSLDELSDTISDAARELGGKDFTLSKQIAEKVGQNLYDKYGKIVKPEEINEVLFETLLKKGYDGTAWVTKIRAKKKSRAQERMGILGSTGAKTTTDAFLMVGSTSKETAKKWDRDRIVVSLINEGDLDLQTASSVAEEAETYIFGADVPHITTQLIREAVHTELIRRELIDAANRYRNFGIPRADLEKLIEEKIAENSNVACNNPEAINFGLAGGILKAYALSSVFSPDVAEAHTNGMVHLHDLDMPTRVYCSAHSLEYLKKYGLHLKNLNASSGPAKHAETLIGHLNTILASMQAYYAGALGIGDINVFFAPPLQKDLEIESNKKIDVLKGKNKDLKKRIKTKKRKEDVSQLEELLAENQKEVDEFEKNPLDILGEGYIDNYLEQKAQSIIFNGSQNAFSRGGQTLFLDFNIHPGVPEHLKETPIILDGKYQLRTEEGKLIALKERKLEEKTRTGYSLMELIDPRNNEVVLKESIKKIGKKEHLVQEMFTKEREKVVTYRDYDNLAKRFTRALLKKFGEGDDKGAPFPFPKCDFHISEKALKDPESLEVINYAYEIASKNGSVYFVMDRDDVTLSACCRLRTTIDDDYVLKHPESMRFCGFQNVTINLPQAAYRAAKAGKKNLDGFLEEIDKAMDIAMKAHLQKKKYIERLQKPGGPQFQTGDIALDGKPYVDLNLATYIIGIIGLNDAAKFLTGKELHELSPEEFKEYGLKTIAHMNAKTKQYTGKTGLKFSLEESPAESATRRLALTDCALFPEAREVVKGNLEAGDVYYTNSVHLAPDAPVDLITRIVKQGFFHPAIESGAITHAFVGEERPNAKAIKKIVEKTFHDTQTAQLTISPEFTICEDCRITIPKLVERCTQCNSEHVYGLTRIVGYFSKIPLWHKSKIQELKERHAGDYSVSKEGNNVIDIPQLEGGSGEADFVAHRFGKPECPMCTQTGLTIENLSKVYSRKGVRLREVYHDVTTDEGMANFLVARLNPSRIPAVVIMNNGEEVYRQQTQYSLDGRANLISAGSIKGGIDEYLARKAAK